MGISLSPRAGFTAGLMVIAGNLAWVALIARARRWLAARWRCAAPTSLPAWRWWRWGWRSRWGEVRPLGAGSVCGFDGGQIILFSGGGAMANLERAWSP